MSIIIIVDHLQILIENNISNLKVFEYYFVVLGLDKNETHLTLLTLYWVAWQLLRRLFVTLFSFNLLLSWSFHIFTNNWLLFIDVFACRTATYSWLWWISFKFLLAFWIFETALWMRPSKRSVLLRFVFVFISTCFWRQFLGSFRMKFVFRTLWAKTTTSTSISFLLFGFKFVLWVFAFKHSIK